MKTGNISKKQHWNTIIIGAGQSGLAAGYFLKKLGMEFVILDNHERIGDSWRNRWDSLMLFTPARHDGLPGMPFPAPKGSFPGKEKMADYLEDYAMIFSLPVQNGVRVRRISSLGHHFEIETSAAMMTAENVIIATGTNPEPRIPPFAAMLSSSIFQIHSSAYRNPGSVPDGDALVVGAATSGIEIALELSSARKAYISGKPTFHIPDNIFKYAGELYWWLISNILTVRTPIGKKARQKIIHGGAPLIRISADDLDSAGVIRLPRMAGVKNGLPLMEDGTVIPVSSVIWCTGFRPDFSWIHMDITDGSGWPVSQRGVSTRKKGLYFVGMPFQYGLTSGLVGGVGRDAAYVASWISRAG